MLKNGGKQGFFEGELIDGEVIGKWCKNVDKLGDIENLSEIVKNLSQFGEEIDSFGIKPEL